MELRKATEMRIGMLNKIRRRQHTRDGETGCDASEVGMLLISETLDEYLEARLESDQVLEGLLADIKKEIRDGSQRVQDVLNQWER